jgi:hypothetical protein
VFSPCDKRELLPFTGLRRGTYIYTDGDTTQVATQNTTKRQLQALACVSCQAIVGATDERAEGWRLYKWGLAVQPAEGINIERFRTDFFVSAYLLALIDTQGTRKFIIETDGATPILVRAMAYPLEFITRIDSHILPALSYGYSIPTSATPSPTRSLGPSER